MFDLIMVTKDGGRNVELEMHGYTKSNKHI